MWIASSQSDSPLQLTLFLLMLFLPTIAHGQALMIEAKRK